MKIEIQDIVSAVGGRLLGVVESPVWITSISIDTRTIVQGALFVPLAGVQVDGHDFIKQAAENGAICALTERQNAPTDTGIPLIYVSSTRRALMALADFYRRSHNVKVVAVTGSAGKTTTKDMIAEICAQKYKTKRTIGNFNNDIGMPLSIFRLEPDDEVLVLEMGMNHAGEIHELSLVGVPDIVVITHIGDAHIENFADRTGILHAKLEIVDGLRVGGTVVLNGNDPLLTGEIAAAKVSGFNVLYPSNENIVSAVPMGLQETRCVFNWHGQEIPVTVPVPGGHMVMNALLATVVGLQLGITPAQITAAFESFTPPEGRLNIFEASRENGESAWASKFPECEANKGRGYVTVIDDVYNANPTSMMEALKVLCREYGDAPETCTASGGAVQKRRRVAILGNMNELGQVAEARHREVGEFAATIGVDLLIAVGNLAYGINEGFYGATVGKDTGQIAMYFEHLELFLPHIKEKLQDGDIVLVKASRTMQFEKIIEAITGYSKQQN